MHEIQESGFLKFNYSIHTLGSVNFANRIAPGCEGEIREGVTLDPPPERFIFHTESHKYVVCTACDNPKHYKVFKDERDVDRTRYHLTGKVFGGMWEVYPGKPIIPPQ